MPSTPLRATLVAAVLAALLSSGAAPGAAAAPGDSAWATVAAPVVYRHSATLLKTGQVLVAGGCTSLDPADKCVGETAAAHLFDPTSGQFVPTGEMTAPRSGHTATPLPDGRVLVVGYVDDTTGRARGSAELYDPTTGRWTATASPSISSVPAFFTHTATALPIGPADLCGANCGKVLVVNVGAELYDPPSGTWAPTQGQFQDVHVNHTATLLSTGNVLITGDGSRNAADVFAELYDPRADTWSPSGQEPVPRAFQTSTKLNDGRILVAGGATFNNLALPQEGSDFGIDAAELYDPEVQAPNEQRPRGACRLAGPDEACTVPGAWSPTQDMTTGRALHAAVILKSGRVLVVGGKGGDAHEGMPTAEVYDPINGRWIPAGRMSVGRGGVVTEVPGFVVTGHSSFTATELVDGRVLILGGNDRPTADLYTSADIVAPSGDKGGGVGLGLIAGTVAVVVGLGVGGVLTAVRRARGSTRGLKRSATHE